MNLLFLRSLGFAVVLVFAFFSHAASAADAPENNSRRVRGPGADRVVIAKGLLADARPATIRNIVDLVSNLYPEANITVVGVDDLTIENLTLQYAKRSVQAAPEARGNLELATRKMPLEGVFTALVEASGRKFRVSSFGPDAFVLSPPERGPGMHPATEVFNLSTTKQSRAKAALEEEIRRSETELGVLRNDYGDKHPRIAEGETRIDILKEQLTQIIPKPNTQLIEQIREVVSVTLKLKSGGEPPEFKYHAGTNLLVVVGTEDAIDITRKVIAALEKTP